MPARMRSPGACFRSRKQASGPPSAPRLSMASERFIKVRVEWRVWALAMSSSWPWWAHFWGETYGVHHFFRLRGGIPFWTGNCIGGLDQAHPAPHASTAGILERCAVAGVAVGTHG